MKKILILSIFLPFIFTSCSKEESSSSNPFAGDWEGVYWGGESGTWEGTVTLNGDFVNGIITRGDSGATYYAIGSVSNSGMFNLDLVAGTVTTGAVFEGTASGNTIVGTWENSIEDLEGDWSGNKK